MRRQVARALGIVVLVSGVCGYSQILPVLPKIAVKMRVVDEEGVAVSGAVARVGFAQGGNAWIGEPKSEVVAGQTDKDGWYRAEARCTGSFGVAAEKEGYYKSSSRYFVYRDRDGEWAPFDPAEGVTVVLRRVVNPIPMYVKRVETKIPRAGEAYGFDLMVGDWVAPYGKGQVSDFVFRVQGYWNSYADNVATMFLSFVNGGDGIQKMDVSMFGGSKFRSCREAPTVGYQPVGIWRKMRIDQPNGAGTTIVRDYDSSAIHVFRIRSVTNERGDVVWAYYGTLRGDIEFGGAGEEGTYLNFTYYLNPTPNDRNLEFDPKRNLFTDLKPGERVYDP